MKSIASAMEKISIVLLTIKSYLMKDVLKSNL